jgi:hypothetical protein
VTATTTGASGGAGKLGWYWQRVRKMSPAELAWRSRDQAMKLAWSRLQSRPGPDGDAVGGAAAVLKAVPHPRAERPFRPGDVAVALAQAPEEARAQLVAAADQLMAGDWDVLGHQRHDMKAPDWFLDPVSGRRAPQGLYCFKVDHRNEEVTGNIKQVWEPSRMHHVTVLAAAYALTGDEAYAKRVAAHLGSWWEENPFLSGAHWTSGIELGIRLISWAWARRLLNGWDGAPVLFEENPIAVRQIWWHQRYLATFVSRGSSANNHVIAEAAGRLVAALAFPWYPESERWAAQAARLLEAELAHNTFPSGVNREMAFEYHGLVAELALVAGAEADLAGRPLSAGTWERLASMLDVIAATVDARLGPPRYGDGDDGHALVLSPEADRWQSLLSAGRAIFGAPEWWPTTIPDVASVVLAHMCTARPAGKRPSSRPAHFDDAGLAILRSAPAHGPEIWCRCDSGPQGFLAIAAHGHADALSVEARFDGVEVLADPGTYCYHGEPQWRSYFRSTLGHNTLELAGRDQSDPGGPFLWSRQARSELLVWRPDDDGGLWSAQHDGYRVLDPPATHRRTVKLRSSQRELEIVDEVTGGGAYACRLAFHFGPQVRASLDGAQLALEWPAPGGGTQRAVISLPPELGWHLARGQDLPVLGWYSARFGVKEPSSSAVGSGENTGSATLTTLLRFLP